MAYLDNPQKNIFHTRFSGETWISRTNQLLRPNIQIMRCSTGSAGPVDGSEIKHANSTVHLCDVKETRKFQGNNGLERWSRAPGFVGLYRGWIEDEHSYYQLAILIINAKVPHQPSRIQWNVKRVFWRLLAFANLKPHFLKATFLLESPCGTPRNSIGWFFASNWSKHPKRGPTIYKWSDIGPL